MELKGRLGAIAGKIPACGVLADVGTDHAYIPMYAVMKGVCSKALATDVRIGPVKIAERNIRRCGLEERIEVRLGPGLEPVACGEADTAVIAGMGGLVINEILRDSLEKARGIKHLILQPMNAVELVRKWLYEEGFAIHEELLVSEGKKLYNILCAGWEGSGADRDEYELYIGRELLHSGDPLLGDYLLKKYNQLNIMIDGRNKSDTGRGGLENLIHLRDRLVADLQRVRMIGGSI